MQLGVFRPNGTKQMVAARGALPANAYHAVRIHLPDVTPPAPDGLTWRVESALASEPTAFLSTELQLRHDAYVGHAGHWAADVVNIRGRLIAESTEGSEIAEGVEERAEALLDTLDAVSPRTGEPFKVPEMEKDRTLRFVWAQRPTLADFALSTDRSLERGLVLVGQCDDAKAAREWAKTQGVRVVTFEESPEIRAFFSVVLEEPAKLPMLWMGDARAAVAGFDTATWDELFHEKRP
jgi:hypothetical protein